MSFRNKCDNRNYRLFAPTTINMLRSPLRVSFRSAPDLARESMVKQSILFYAE